MSWISVKNCGRSTIKYKEVQTEKPHLKKVLAFSVIRRVRTDVVALVRDNRIVKITSAKINGTSLPKRRANHIGQSLLLRIGYDRSIRSESIGKLWKKYDIPPSARELILKNKDYAHRICRNFSTLRKLSGLSTDQMVSIFKSNSAISFYNFSGYENYNMLSRLTTHQIITFLTGDRFVLLDSMRFYKQISYQKPEALQGFDWRVKPHVLHDRLAALWTSISTIDVNLPIPWIDNTRADIDRANEIIAQTGWKLKLAETGLELIQWGSRSHLDNCIGGYVKDAHLEAKKETCVLVGLYNGANGMPEYALQLKRISPIKWSIIQFEGKYRFRDNDVYELILSALNVRAAV